MRWWEFSSTSSTSACIPVLPNPLGPVSHEKNAILESLGKDMKAFKLLLLPPGLLPEWEFFSIFYPHRVNRVNYSTMYHVQPLRLFRSSIPKQNPSHHDHVICDGSHFWIFLVIFPNLIFFIIAGQKYSSFVQRTLRGSLTDFLFS